MRSVQQIVFVLVCFGLGLALAAVSTLQKRVDKLDAQMYLLQKKVDFYLEIRR